MILMAKTKTKILWGKLAISIVLAQAAGGIGTLFTFNAIPTWYAFLNKPSFSPPNWLFGPVWTILYTLIGISFYIIWTKHNKKTFWMMKLFLFHLFLNAIWSPIFFGAKNLGIAFIVILLMDITLIKMIKNFYKLSKVAALILIPYFIWISFASLLNFSIWRLNPSNVYAQELNSTRAYEDYIFTEDYYKRDLFDFNLKKGSYQKNPTLSLKEEFRLAAYKFTDSRNKYLISYLTLARVKISESKGLDNSEKDSIFQKIDNEVNWYAGRKSIYQNSDTLETILDKSKQEDVRFTEETIPAIYFSLSYSNLGNVVDITKKHIIIYNKLKDEANKIVQLGRADSSLFDRWYKDIDSELSTLSLIANNTKSQIVKIYGPDTYQRSSSYKKSLDEISLSKSSLLKLNKYILELENVISNKR